MTRRRRPADAPGTAGLAPEYLRIVTLMEAMKDKTVAERVQALEDELRALKRERAALEAERAALSAPFRSSIRALGRLLCNFAIDLVVFVSLRAMLAVVAWIEHVFPGSAFSDLLGRAHGWGIVATYIVLAVFLVWDIFLEKFGLKELTRLLGQVADRWLRRQLRKKVGSS